MDYLTERDAIAILDDVDAIEVENSYNKFSMKAQYVQREGFHVVGRVGGLVMEFTQKLLNIANKHNATMELDAINNEIIVKFYGLPKKAVGQAPG